MVMISLITKACQDVWVCCLRVLTFHLFYFRYEAPCSYCLGESVAATWLVSCLYMVFNLSTGTIIGWDCQMNFVEVVCAIPGFSTWRCRRIWSDQSIDRCIRLSIQPSTRLSIQPLAHPSISLSFHPSVQSSILSFHTSPLVPLSLSLSLFLC